MKGSCRPCVADGALGLATSQLLKVVNSNKLVGAFSRMS